MIRKSRNGDFWILDGGTHIDAWAEAAGRLDHDQNALPLALAHVPEGGAVVDAGAYTGDWTIALLRKVGPTGQVLAFEPNPEPFEALRLNCPAALAFNVALSDHAGAGRLMPASDTNHGTCRVMPGLGNVEMVTLDSLVMRRLSFLKIDAEGSELRILKGAAETIKQFKPVMVIEVNQSTLEGVGTSPAELLAFIKSLNYSVENIYARQEMAGLQFDVLCKPI